MQVRHRVGRSWGKSTFVSLLGSRQQPPLWAAWICSCYLEGASSSPPHGPNQGHVAQRLGFGCSITAASRLHSPSWAALPHPGMPSPAPFFPPLSAPCLPSPAQKSPCVARYKSGSLQRNCTIVAACIDTMYLVLVDVHNSARPMSAEGAWIAVLVFMLFAI